MNNYTISIFQNKIFFQIITEMKLFCDFKFKHYDDLDSPISNQEENEIFIFFNNHKNNHILNKLEIYKVPFIIISEDVGVKNNFSGEFKDQLNIPFSILEFKKKVTLLIAKINFKKNSFIYLKNYIIDKNERKIKKGKLELQLSEKEIDFLVLFSKNKEPVTRNFILKKVWNYSAESETHTIETHVHRLRKKIFEKFDDKNFIKNNNKGYYI